MSQSSKGRVEIQLTNIQPQLKKDLKEIAKNKGKTLTDLLRPYLLRCREENEANYTKAR